MDIFNDDIKEKFLENPADPTKKRESLDCNISDQDTLEEDTIGKNFPFLNRVKESSEYAKVMYNMSLLNRKSVFDNFKRKMCVPVIMGLAGLGKTTFVRKAFEHSLETIAPVEGGLQDFVVAMKSALNIRIGEFAVNLICCIFMII